MPTPEEQKKVEPAPPATNGETDQDVDSVPLYRRKRLIIPVFIFALIAAGAIWYWYATIRGFISTDDAFIDGDRVSISPKMIGRIAKLYAKEGDHVTLGEMLVQLDTTDLAAQAVQARATLEMARQSVGPTKVALDRAQEDLTRSDQEIAGGTITREQHDHAVKTLDAAHADFSLAQARIVTAEAQLHVVDVQLQNSRIISPIDGSIAKRWMLEGDVAQAGQPIFSVYDNTNLWVTANFEETNLHAIHLNDPVEISVDAYPNTSFSGKVFELGTYTASEFSLIPPNNASGNFTKVTQRVPVKISIDNLSVGTQTTPLLPGMSVEIRLKER
ncbi:MAG TPA: HlyD family secretion protein [Bacteroidota bacterium]|nr:HlyD family secretion protein [Bacteroidota bacterium]